MKAIILFAIAAVQPASTSPKYAWVCKFHVQYHCSESGPCVSSTPTHTITADPNGKWYSHCSVGQTGCIAYPAHFSSSQKFLIVQVDGIDASAKIDERHTVIESYTTGQDAYVAYGTCKDTVVPPPMTTIK